MDVDGFDPYEDEYEWRDALEVMGEKFQEQLKEKGIKRRLPRRPESVLDRLEAEAEAQERGLVPSFHPGDETLRDEPPRFEFKGF